MTATAKKKLDLRKYGEMLAEIRPRVIKTEAEHREMSAVIDRLHYGKGEDDLTPEEAALLDLVSNLVGDYEDEHYKIPEAPPGEMLKYLMEERDLAQKDIAAVLGSKGIVSEISNGKREISKANAKKLAEFFKVYADLFN